MNQKTPKNLAPHQLMQWFKKKSTQPILIDVREDSELEIARFPFETMHIPLSKLQTFLTTLSEKLPIDKPVVVLCHSGIRSWNFGMWLIEQDPRYEVWNLVGGIDAWSLEIDQSVPRY